MALNSPTLEETGENEGPNTLSTTSGEQTFALRFVSTFAKVFGVLGGIWLVLEIISYFIPEKPLSTYRIKGLFGLFSLGMIVGLIWELIVLHALLPPHLAGLRLRTAGSDEGRELHMP